MGIVVPIIVGVISGLLASLIFYTFLRALKPNIVISDKIAKSGDRFLIKIVNKANRDAIDIRAELLLMTPITVPGGIVWKRERLSLRPEYLMILPKYDKKDKDAKYAFRFSTEENLFEICNKPQQYLSFKIIAKDEVSGFGKVFIQKYYTEKDILEGSFEFGESLEIR